MDSPEPLRLTIVDPTDGADAHLLVVGEVDLATAPQLEAALRDLLTVNAGDLRVDCRGLAFIDSSGVSVLVAAEHELARDGRKLVLKNASEQFRQVLAVTALDEVFVLE